MQLNDLVKYSKPQKGEEDIRFRLREINGDRVLLELVCDMPIRPLETILIQEICLAENVRLLKVG